MTQGRGRVLSLVILGALTTFGPMAIDLYLPAFPDVAADLRVSVMTVPLTLTAAMLGLGLGQVFYGPLSDRYGRKRPLVAGLILFTSLPSHAPLRRTSDSCWPCASCSRSVDPPVW